MWFLFGEDDEEEIRKPSEGQQDLVVRFEQGGRDVVVRQGPAVQGQAAAAALAVVRVLDPDVQLFAPEVLFDGESVPRPGDGGRPRMPSTQPTITVEAVPVNQWTWERPKCLLAGPSVNCP